MPHDQTPLATSVSRAGDHFSGRFDAMASPCELLLATQDRRLAERLTLLAAREAKRIEAKFSRYREDSVVQRINRSAGRAFEVDAETANLLDYAAQCHALSGGLFDITSGVLRQAWRFDGSANLPSADAVKALLGRVGWTRVHWERPVITLPGGMEIDLGGIGKEYAVDSTVALLRQHPDASFVVNFGGDLYVTGPRPEGPWRVAVEDPRAEGGAIRTLSLPRGGIATSGDARRFLLKDGVRYGHILDPRTGWPVPDAPRSVTVLAGSCLEAGMLATFAILHGRDAAAFLETQQVQFWIG
jgi:thiamine biosynthesis lipoprotein